MSTKENILEVSVRLFNDEGTHRITTNHIIDDLGISPGTLYYHFPNKEAIIRAVFYQIINDFGLLFEDAAGASDIDSFINFISSVFELLYRYRFFYIDISMLLQRDPELQELYNDNRRGRFSLQEGMYRSLVDSGVFRRIDSKNELKILLDNLWLASDFWYSYRQTETGQLKKSDIHEGVRHYLVMLKPYCTETALKKINEFL